MNRTMAIFGILLILVLGVAAHAETSPLSNPTIRACHISGGDSHVISISAKNDEFVFCQYGEVALLDGSSVFALLQGQAPSLAITAYKKTTTTNMNACYDFGGQVVSGSDSEGFKFLFCSFVDASAIELSTLSNGQTSPANTEINKSLGL